MKYKIHLPFIVSLLCLHSQALFAQSDVYLKAYAKTFQRLAIDLYPMSTETSDNASRTISEMITEVLSNDLWMSGYFKVNVKTGVPEPNTSNSTDGNSSAIAIITGKFSMADGRLFIKPEVIDQASRKAIIRSDYEAGSGKERYLVHKIADDIVYRLTGERGIARTKVAFVKQKADGTKEVALMDYDGYHAQQITTDNSINLSPAWSPDGQKLCYTSYKNDNPDLYLLNLRTNTPTPISKVTGLNSAPAWSPDGRFVALTLSKDGNAEIYLLDVGDKKFRRLTYSRGIDSSPTWSPSNRQIAFTSDRTGSPQIYIMDADGLNVRRLTFEGSYNDSPAWSPRGDKIAYVSRTESGFDIYTIDVTGQNQMRLTDSSRNNENPTWSPNGFALVFSSDRSGSRQLYSMFWDGSDQKKLTTGGINYSPAWSPRLN